ncbi:MULTISPECIES: type IV secretory system conjugative DNA transfer family protein [Streptomyces]|uniref:ATP-binding protein n=2 Tax=Streptomyces rimosus subsp. rimosus TaxID=132474 RepID=L8EXP2_STRR1|nr:MULTISPECIES: ATP/GTP-binding protein [Streptomyces]KOG73913.1 ATP-binding protein [Kitasatospora aureofaciens]MYT48008.1 ATP-binding protein [Streptomyces sp. SID5471]KEF04223.1 ATP-binding protein [Streptomyces rimosus]KOT37441.1 ATP-binding protein [Streptomyces sp. NRRL WC-3701]KOT38925.1 ATP-binding protein [Streptomyces rimosus subsp. rimosus]
MDTEGTQHDAPHTRTDHHVPRPAAPPVPPAPPSAPSARPSPGIPPVPSAPPAFEDGAFLRWLRAPRRAAAPGIWTYGHVPRPAENPDRVPTRQLVTGALISFLCGWLLWSLLWNGYLGPYWLYPLLLLTPDSWRSAGGDKMIFVTLTYLYYALVLAVLVLVFGRLGRWRELGRRLLGPVLRRAREQRPDAVPEPEADRAQWPALRAGGAPDAADKLAAEALAGRMNDVDVSRIERAWHSVRSGKNSLASFTDTVLRHGAAACAHPSGLRDLPARAAHHDLLAQQVRIGTATDHPRNPHAHRGAGCALDPALLGTSLLAVGPPGCGKTTRVVRPVVEAMCLQALAGRGAVVAVGAAGSALGPDDAFDAVVRIGAPEPDCDIDLYGGTTDPDEAAGILAEALVGDLAATLPGGDSRRAATALGQLLGPYRAAHGRFPSVPELRELLDGSATALDALRDALEAAGAQPLLRELDARARQSGRPGDIGDLLADRVALLDRPAFAPYFDPEGGDRQISLRALDHPLRVRIDLPERGHAEASRILARLVLAQFTECAAARTDRSLFACLVLDDAAHTVTAESLRGLQRLRAANAGVLLTLRSLDDVPESLRSALLGAVGCRMAFAGVTTWDGARFAEVWGKEWVETRDVTDRQIIAEGAAMKAFHIFRHLVTGKAATAKAVTVRTVERERWSASDLANSVPPGHAVLSVTSVRGEHAPPVLVDLRG